MSTDVVNFIRGAISDECELSSSFSNDESIKELGMDSLSTIEVILRIESKYNVVIDIDDISSVVLTINSLASVVTSKL